MTLWSESRRTKCQDSEHRCGKLHSKALHSEEASIQQEDRADNTSIFSYVSQVARHNPTGRLEMWDIARGHYESGAHKYLCSYLEGLHRNPRSGMVTLHESHTCHCIPLPKAGGESPEGKKVQAPPFLGMSPT